MANLPSVDVGTGLTVQSVGAQDFSVFLLKGRNHEQEQI